MTSSSSQETPMHDPNSPLSRVGGAAQGGSSKPKEERDTGEKQQPGRDPLSSETPQMDEQKKSDRVPGLKDKEADTSDSGGSARDSGEGR
jgi:hypothetical protein